MGYADSTLVDVCAVGMSYLSCLYDGLSTTPQSVPVTIIALITRRVAKFYQ